MGRDIHLHIINKNGNFIEKDIFDGRNSEWFTDMEGWGHGFDREFEYWKPEFGIPENVPEEIRVIYDDNKRPLAEGETYWDREHYGYYDFRYATVKEWKEFFETYKPHLDAGWISRYDAYLWRVKGIAPEEPIHFLDSDARIEDWEWVEFEKEYDCSRWLYNYVVDNNIPDDVYLVYYFDC